MTGLTVFTPIIGTDCEVDHLLDSDIQGAIGHDLLDTLPRSSERWRMICDGHPEITHPLDIAGALNIVIDGSHLFGCIFVGNQVSHGDVTQLSGRQCE